jgi:transcriptional regulator with XRE-family HTH domain
MVKRKGYSRKERPAGIAKYLTDLRLENKLTQQEIADKIGKSRSYICKIERGKRERKTVPQKSLRDFILYKLAEAYGADLAEVLEKADCPQLLLLNTTEEERQQLIDHLNTLRQRKEKSVNIDPLSVTQLSSPPPTGHFARQRIAR